MSSEPREYLRHILAEADYLADASVGLTLDRFRENPTLRPAFVRSLEVMGEATKQLSPEFRGAHPEVPWSEMARMRDRLIHGYVSIDDLLVWQAVRQEVPQVRSAIAAILANGD